MQEQNQTHHASNDLTGNIHNNIATLDSNNIDDTGVFNMPDEISDVNHNGLLADDAIGDNGNVVGDHAVDGDDISDRNGGHTNPNVSSHGHTDFEMADADGVDDTAMQRHTRHNSSRHDPNTNAAMLAQDDGPSLAPEGAMGGGVTVSEDQRLRQVNQSQAGVAQQQQHSDVPGGNNEDEQAGMDDEPPLEGYERTDRVGQGAYGIVYRGIQRSTGSTVAIKRIPFAEATPEGGVPCNVIREISLLRELDHPNVVRLLDVNQAQPGELYLVFEFVAFDLKTFMDQQQSSTAVSERVGLEPRVVKNFMKQILQGVGFCHTYRVLHRDLKPHNLLISQDGTQLKLADFGLARLSGLPNGPYTYEVVTLWYRAPELLLGASRYSTAVDMWSVGCIFAEMATGLPLFPGRSDIDQLFKIFQRRGTPTADIWQNYPRLPYFNSEFPQWRARPISDLISSSMGRNTSSTNTGGSMADSPHAMDLMEQILQYDPDRRLVCKTALQHPYFFSQ